MVVVTQRAALDGVCVLEGKGCGDFGVALMAVVSMLRHLGLLSDYPFEALAEQAFPPVLGGGRPVGAFEVLEA